MLRRLIRSIRRQPKPVRDQLALISAGVFTAVVAFVWVYHVPTKFAALNEQRQMTAHDTEGPSFSQLFGGMREQVAAVRDAFSADETEDTPVVDTAAEPTVPAYTAATPPATTIERTASSSIATSTPASLATSTATTSTAASEPRPVRIIAVPKATTTAPNNH